MAEEDTSLSKFTYSLDVNNELALSLSKQIENIIKQAIKNIQQEGQRVQYSARSFTQEGQRSTEYYMPRQFAGPVRQAVENYIQGQSEARFGQPGAIPARVSTITDVSMHQSARKILSDAERNRVEANVTRYGGTFQTDDRGVSHWSVDRSLVRQTQAGMVPVYKSIDQSVTVSNAQYKRNWENVVSKAFGNEVSYGDFSQEEHDQLSRHARSINAESGRTYTNLIKRERRNEAKRQFIRSYPRSSAAMEAKSKRRRSRRSQVRFAKMATTAVLGTISQLIQKSVNILASIEQGIESLTISARQRSLVESGNNLATGTMNKWEALAKTKLYDESLLPSAAAATMAKVGVITDFDKEFLGKIALYGGGDAVDAVTKNMQNGATTLTQMSAIIDPLVANIVKGYNGSGFTTMEQAKGQILNQFPDYKNLMNIYFDAAKQAGYDNPSEWISKITGGEYSGFSGFILGDWAGVPDPGKVTGQDQASQESARAVGEDVIATKETIKYIIEGRFYDAINKFSGAIDTVVSWVRKLLAKFDPEQASLLSQAVTEDNRSAQAWFNNNMSFYKANANIAANALGFSSVSDPGYAKMVQSLSEGKLTDKNMLSTLLSNPDLLRYIQNYQDAVQAQKDLAVQLERGSLGATDVKHVYGGKTFTVKSGQNISGLLQNVYRAAEEQGLLQIGTSVDNSVETVDELINQYKLFTGQTDDRYKSDALVMRNNRGRLIAPGIEDGIPWHPFKRRSRAKLREGFSGIISKAQTILGSEDVSLSEIKRAQLNDIINESLSYISQFGFDKETPQNERESFLDKLRTGVFTVTEAQMSANLRRAQQSSPLYTNIEEAYDASDVKSNIFTDVSRKQSMEDLMSMIGKEVFSYTMVNGRQKPITGELYGESVRDKSTGELTVTLKLIDNGTTIDVGSFKVDMGLNNEDVTATVNRSLNRSSPIRGK